jgi:SAM-dependent methyltransferase
MSAIPPSIRTWARRSVSPRNLVWLRCVTRGFPVPKWGNLRRVRPFSEQFGFERGTPVDRYYLHRFLDRHRELITGRVLEIQAPGYTLQYGHDLTTSDSIDIVSNGNAQLTYLCDLAKSEGIIPDDTYDCFLLPNTLCVLRDVEGCLRNALRVVRPGGVILATSVALAPLTGDAPDYWHASAAGWREITGRVWPGCDVQIEQHGNCLAAVAAMLGLAHEELEPSELDVYDARYPVMVTVYCRRPR